MESLIDAIACVGSTAQCDFGGLGGATPALALLLTSAAIGGGTLIVALWKDVIKSHLKDSPGDLFAVTVFLVAFVFRPSLVGLTLVGVILLAALLCRKTLSGKRLAVGGGINLGRLVVPMAALGYIATAGAGAVVEAMRASPEAHPDRHVAFVAPSDFINTSLEDLALENRSSLLYEIDLAPRSILSGPMADASVRFEPQLDQQGYTRFRERFSRITSSQLDYLLSQDETLSHLRDEVDIALEASVMVQNNGGADRSLVLRAHVGQRDPNSNQFRRVVSGPSIVARGTVGTLDQVVLVLTVRLAAKMLDVLDLSAAFSPAAEETMWRDLGYSLEEAISDIRDSSDSNLGAAGTEARGEAPGCAARDCALETAGHLERMIEGMGEAPSKLPTATAAYEAAYEK